MKYLGEYRLPNDTTLVGELVLDGPRTTLSVHSSHDIPALESNITLQGVSYSGHCLTLINCNSSPASISHGRDKADRYRSSIFPHHVLMGREHLDPGAKAIERIEFGTTDLNCLFYDFDAFGTVVDSSSIIDSVLAERRQLRAVETGDEPVVAYFSGKNQIVSARTVIGTISAEHRPQYSLGGPAGVFIKNKMAVCIVPEEPLDFEQVLRRVYDVSKFLSVAAGRAQGVSRIRLSTHAPAGKKPQFYSVHPSLRWKVHGKGERFKPHPAEVPLDPVRRPEEFQTVLSNWLEHHDSRRVARARSHECLKKTNHYGPERLVAAANMFDLLPTDAVPGKTALSVELRDAKARALDAFQNLPESIDKHMVTSALGRLGQPSLPKKVRHRTQIIEARLDKVFPDLQWVAGVAVKCRNVLVHGGDELDIGKVESFVPFLTDTLEFIFTASDFIEAGWESDIWASNAYSWGHSFTRYRHDYAFEIAELKMALSIKPASLPRSPK